MLESEEGRETAMKIWNSYILKVAPTLYSDRRRQALEDIFDLKLPKKPAPSPSQDLPYPE